MITSPFLITPLSQASILQFLHDLPSQNIFSFITSTTPVQTHYTSLYRSFAYPTYLVEQLFLLLIIIFFTIQIIISLVMAFNVLLLLADLVVVATLCVVFILTFIPKLKERPRSKSVFTWIIMFVFFVENIMTTLFDDEHNCVHLHKVYFSIAANHFIMDLFIKISVTMNFNHFIIVAVCDVVHVVCMIIFKNNFHSELLFVCLLDFYIFANEIRNEVVSMKMFVMYIKEQKKRNESVSVIHAAKIGRCKCKMWLQQDVKCGNDSNSNNSDINRNKCSMKSDNSCCNNNMNGYCNGQNCLLNCDEIEISELNQIMEKEMSFCIDTSIVRKYIHEQEQHTAQTLRNKNKLNVHNEKDLNSTNIIQMLFRNNNNNSIEDILDVDNSKDFLNKKEEKDNCGLFVKKTQTNNNIRRRKYRHSKTYNSNCKKYLLCNNIYQKQKEQKSSSNSNNNNNNADQAQNKIITQTLKEIILKEIKTFSNNNEHYRDLGIFSIHHNKSLFRIYFKLTNSSQVNLHSSMPITFDLLFIEIIQNKDEYKQKVESIYQNLIMSKISNEFREGITSLINIINSVKTTHPNPTANPSQQPHTPSSTQSNCNYGKPQQNHLSMPQQYNTKRFFTYSSSILSPNCVFSINYSTLNKLAIISECVLIIVADLAEYVHIKSSDLVLNKNEGNKSFLSFLDLKFFLEEAAVFYIGLFRKDIKMVFDIDNKLYSVKILTNELKLKQIITNVLSNAIKQTPNNKSVVFRICGSDYNGENEYSMDINETKVNIINNSNEDNDSLTYDQNNIEGYHINQLSKVKRYVKISFIIEDQGKGLSNYQMHKLNKNDFNLNNSERSFDIHITKANNYLNKKGLNSGLKIIRKLANEINAKLICEHIFLDNDIASTHSEQEHKQTKQTVKGTRINITLVTQFKNMNVSQGIISSAITPTVPKTLSTQNTLYKGVVKLNPHMKKLIYEEDTSTNINNININVNMNDNHMNSNNNDHFLREKTAQSEQQKHTTQFGFKKCQTEFNACLDYHHNNTVTNNKSNNKFNLLIHSNTNQINQKHSSPGSNCNSIFHDQSAVSKNSAYDNYCINTPHKVISKTVIVNQIKPTVINNDKQHQQQHEFNNYEHNSNLIFHNMFQMNSDTLEHKQLQSKNNPLLNFPTANNETYPYHSENIIISPKGKQIINKIMIVDDSINHQTNIEVLIKRFFKKKQAECTIVKFEDGAEVLNELYNEINANDGNVITKMIFCDEQMKFINGSQCFTVIKQSSIKGTCKLDVPFVLCSADASNLRMNSKSMGLEFIYDKPLSIGDIEYIFTSKVINGCNNEIDFS